MQLSNQVVSQSLARQLKEAGVPQSSLFYWIYTDAPLKDGSRNKIVLGETLGDSHWELGGEQDTYSAFTCSELGEMLPNMVIVDGKNAWMEFSKNDKGYWQFNYEWYGEGADCIVEHAQTEAEVRGQMLLYLLTNNLINPSTLSEGG